MQPVHGPAAIILLGDIDAPRPLHLELKAIRGLTEIYWIPGNHDSDDNNAWTNLVYSELAQPICIAEWHRLDPGVSPASAGFLGAASGRRLKTPPFPVMRLGAPSLIARRPPKDFGLAESSRGAPAPDDHLSGGYRHP